MTCFKSALVGIFALIAFARHNSLCGVCRGDDMVITCAQWQWVGFCRFLDQITFRLDNSFTYVRRWVLVGISLTHSLTPFKSYRQSWPIVAKSRFSWGYTLPESTNGEIP
jgi:hypothetical protein